MKYAVIGSRGFDDYSLLEKTLNKRRPFEIVSGGARGADSLAARYAREYDIPLTEFIPDYKRYDKGALKERNKLIVETAQKVIAFWDGASTGTLYTISYAESKDVPVEIVRYRD